MDFVGWGAKFAGWRTNFAGSTINFAGWMMNFADRMVVRIENEEWVANHLDIGEWTMGRSDGMTDIWGRMSPGGWEWPADRPDIAERMMDCPDVGGWVMGHK